jgi:hypothetical protein
MRMQERMHKHALSLWTSCTDARTEKVKLHPRLWGLELERSHQGRLCLLSASRNIFGRGPTPVGNGRCGAAGSCLNGLNSLLRGLLQVLRHPLGCLTEL